MNWKHVVLGVVVWEGAWWAARKHKRGAFYREAKDLARRLGKPLVVVGAPDRGATSSPSSADDIVVDIAPSNAPNFIQADICQRIPLPDNSAVVYVSCVLEYVSDANAAMRELLRVSGGDLFVCRVEPWTLTAYLYPGAKRTLRGDIKPPAAHALIAAPT